MDSEIVYAVVEEVIGKTGKYRNCALTLSLLVVIYDRVGFMSEHGIQPGQVCQL